MSDRPVYSTPVRYRVLVDAYIDDVYCPASTDTVTVFVEYAGHPGTALAPTDDEGRKRQAAYFKKRGKTVEQATAEKHRIFIDLFHLSTYLLSRRDLPALPAAVRARMGFSYGAA